MKNDKLIGIINLVRGISEDTTFVLNEKLIFESSRYNLKITVLPGFQTDGASSPRYMWPFIDPWSGKYLAAAIIHDCLYGSHVLNKIQSDLIFLDCMNYCKVNKTISNSMYAAVNWFGNFNWNNIDSNTIEYNKQFIILESLSQ